LLHPLSVFLHLEGPHPSGEGRGTRDRAPWLGASWGGEEVVVVVGGREDEPTSTIDAVDVQLKLHSHTK